jgi:MarR family transcriptional regulator for hemolysin
MDPFRAQLSSALAADITIMSRLYRSAIEQCAHRHDLTLASAWPIVLIGRSETGIRHGVLAEMVGIEAASLIRVIDRLVTDQLVLRSEDPLDRRAKILCLTAAGHEQAAKMEASLATLRVQAFSDISTEEMQVCQQVFARLQHSLEQFIATGAA